MKETGMQQKIRKFFTWAIIVTSIFINISWTLKATVNTNKDLPSALFFSTCLSPQSDLHTMQVFVYDSLQLEQKGLSQEAFEYAMNGFATLQNDGYLKNDSILTIVDFDQPSYNKRLYVIDIKNYKILFNTLVAHGKNSGKEWAQSFSNKAESNKSSLGFYVTEGTYNGSNGFSLKLSGMEAGLNSNAFQRAIVMHGADYVNDSYIRSQGYIGRSLGCPAVPEKLNRPIIEKIKNGSCLFIYNKSYKKTSKIFPS
ncbi:MAG TPA: murein L,D-transpeptidase catalytic domain family protein [Niabella sp.]|nr:murein L,D-transpeptidase catalytic domain family protein [Chitinophagaceae bacterium]HRO85207.1 murein L,D-transpeptidase catalytic domain family protein [Niabella sp.]